MTRPAEKYFSSIEEKLTSDYAGMFREPGGALKHPFLTPGSDQYRRSLGLGLVAEQRRPQTNSREGREHRRIGSSQAL